ncbi:hypothetical protein ABT126_36925 [Streptomyces sp. NPDC002012]|uniref:hypothetical protein n=1 Tax=unclassified Streptomyces TaxID=2593676 RepID=UPI002E167B29|nr:hypothetical protein OG609_45180 [Streptomyces sp. NBC_01224]
MAVDIRVSPGDVVVTRDHHGYLSFGYTISASRYQKGKSPPVESGHDQLPPGSRTYTLF